ncbi:MAG TPA: family 16 glycosylhydrolase [Sedimentisphaerales bacterium]|nr:family 16 glycosylhydrolase [Sedimentisphaerales bacterium]
MIFKKVLLSIFVIAFLLSSSSLALEKASLAKMNLGDPDRYPVAWYKFDESSGALANDSSDSGFNAAVNRSDCWQQTNGRWGGCLANTEAAGYLDVQVPASAFNSLTNEITISFWIWTDFQNSTERLFSGYSSSKTKIIDMYMRKSSSSDQRYLYFNLGQDSSGVYDSRSWSGYKPISIQNENSWHHIALVRDIAQGVDMIYYDGIFQATWYLDTAKTLDGIETFHLFNGGGTTSSECFHGKIDDFMVYDVALTSYEIAKIYGRSIYAADFDGDTIVGIEDLKILASQWLSSNKNITADADRDGKVNMVDYAIMVQNWCRYDLDKPGYKLVFHDEFDGNEVDEFLWTKGLSWGTGADALPAFTDDAFVFENGILHIMDEKRPCYDVDGTLKEYSTGCLQTARKFEYNYGWYEVRCQMPGYRGAFPAFWLFPHHDTYYPRAEIDIMEHVHSWGNVTSCNMHWNGYGTEHQSLGAQKYNVPNIWTQFHTYSLLWSPGNIKFYADGYMFYEYSGTPVPAEAMYIILNGMVRDYHGDGVDDASLPASFKVDYVRVYKKL